MRGVWKSWLVGAVVFLSLLWFWPNLVHEPLHWLALRLQGVDGIITQEWSFPPHPSITRVGQVAGLGGGLLYLLLPSVANLGVLGLLWLTRKRTTVVTHIAPAIYVTFDLCVNIAKFNLPLSDFHFLIALPAMVWMVLFVVAFGVGSTVLFGLLLWRRSDGVY